MFEVNAVPVPIVYDLVPSPLTPPTANAAAAIRPVIALKLVTTAAASNGAPSWKVIPSRSVMVHVLRSLEGEAVFARRPTMSPPMVFSNKVS